MPDLPPFLTKRDRVVELLRTQILRGELSSGTQLRQDEIAGRLGLSSTPVREAFGILESEGLLERRPHRGVIVLDADYGRIEETYQLRGVLEIEAVRRLIARGDDAAIEPLEQLIIGAAEALGRPEVHEFRVKSVEFHRQLVNASGSEVLKDLYGLLASRSSFLPPLDSERLARAHEDHTRILDAVWRRDAAGAGKYIVAHLQWNADLVQGADGEYSFDGRGRS